MTRSRPHSLCPPPADWTVWMHAGYFLALVVGVFVVTWALGLWNP